MHRSAATGHAFVAATIQVPTVAEAVVHTEEARLKTQAQNQQVSCCQSIPALPHCEETAVTTKAY